MSSSNLSTKTQPHTVVLKPGTYQSAPTKGGLNLSPWIKRFLKRIGFADTVDCCTYYPTFPIVVTIDNNNPTEEEMVNVPVGGVFIALQSAGDFSVGSIQIKVNTSSAAQLIDWN